MTLIPMLRRNQAALLVSAGFLLLAACNPFGGGGNGGGGTLSRTEAVFATATARGSVPQPTPSPTAVVEPTATPPPTPTPTPSPTLGQALVESLVWSEVSRCAEQVAAPLAAAEGGGAVAAQTVDVNVVFESSYDAANLRWIVSVVTNDDLLSFGQWAIADDLSGSVTPRDATAGRIAATGTRCALPNALLDDVPTPPLFLPADPLVPDAELAAIQVWTTVYGCFQDFPAFESFQARPGLQGNWIVEGKAATTPYGLWEVNATTGVITPRDDLARQVDDARREESCAPSEEKRPAAVTAQEASILTWVASYDCFTPHPLFGAFVTRVEDPRRWVVEGRGTVDLDVEVTVETESGTETFTETRTETAFYGLWLVNTETGRVTGADILAATMAEDDCFKQLQSVAGAGA